MIRGDKIQVTIEEGAHLPARVAPTGGLALRIKEGNGRMLYADAEIHTGVRVKLPAETIGIIVTPKELMAQGIESRGVVYEDDTSEIVVHLYNYSSRFRKLHNGDVVGELVIVPVWYADVEWVDRFYE